MSAAIDYDRTPQDEAPAAEPVAERPLRWTATVMTVASLFLLVFNARSLSSWMAEADKSPTPATLQARAVAEGWTAATAAVWLDRPHGAIRALWARRKASADGGAQR